jgi:hypothetical protein
MSKAQKGSAFERQICKELSLWWTEGQRDDVFWRTSGSGARATTRGKRGSSTYGQYGDIAATDPIGEPLLKFVTIELKRGYNKATPWDLLDAPEKAAKQTFEKFLCQAEDQRCAADTPGFWLITKRDQRQPIITMPKDIMADMEGWCCFDNLYYFEFQYVDTGFVSLRYKEFLETLDPQNIKDFDLE